MKVLEKIDEVHREIQTLKSTGKTIGLVPTMGALHQGHLQLIQASRNQCDITIASIFVNPTQFNNPQDLKNYPRTSSSDLAKLKKSECDLVFMPSEFEMYPKKPSIEVNFGSLGNQLEGKFRPGHFDGVGIVVSKLFNIIQPHLAFFGQKDLQQFFIIKALVDQLNFPLKLNMVSTVREDSGLAMSSRNMRLTAEERNEAALIYKSLLTAQELLLSHTSVLEVNKKVQELFKNHKCLTLEYFEIINTNDFKTTEEIIDEENIAMCIAAEIGQVRLIDNLMLIS